MIDEILGVVVDVVLWRGEWSWWWSLLAVLVMFGVIGATVYFTTR